MFRLENYLFGASRHLMTRALHICLLSNALYFHSQSLLVMRCWYQRRWSWNPTLCVSHFL